MRYLYISQDANVWEEGSAIKATLKEGGSLTRILSMLNLRLISYNREAQTYTLGVTNEPNREEDDYHNSRLRQQDL